MVNNITEKSTTENKYVKLSGCRYISKKEYAQIMQPTDTVQIRINNGEWLRRRDIICDYIVRIVALCVAVVLGFSLVPRMYTTVSDNYTYKHCLDTANGCIANMEYDKALAALDGIKDIKNKDVTELILLKASVCIYTDKYDEAIKLLEDANNKQANGEYVAKLDEVKYIKSIHDYNKEMSKLDDDNVGMMDDDILSTCTKAIDAKPDEFKPYVIASQVYVNNGEYDKAINLLQSGVDVCSDKAGSVAEYTYHILTNEINKTYCMMNNREYNKLYNEVVEACASGLLDEALLKYKSAKAINGRDYRLYATLAKAYTKENSYDEAVGILNEGIKSLSVYSHNSKLKYRYNYLVNLRTKVYTIQKYVDSYNNYYAKLYKECARMTTSKDYANLEKMLVSSNYKTMSSSANVTYYNSLGKFVDNMVQGRGIAVYKNNYLYYGTWKNGLKQGYGTYMASSISDGKLVTYVYEGKWAKGYPSGKGKITYIVKQDGQVIYKTVTSGTFAGGYEHGKMKITKFDKKEYGDKKVVLNYTAVQGIPQYLKDKKGKVRETSTGEYIIGYYYVGNEKKEVVATKEKLVWRVQGLAYKNVKNIKR